MEAFIKRKLDVKLDLKYKKNNFEISFKLILMF